MRRTVVKALTLFFHVLHNFFTLASLENFLQQGRKLQGTYTGTGRQGLRVAPVVISVTSAHEPVADNNPQTRDTGLH